MKDLEPGLVAIRIQEGIEPGEEVWTGFAGQYVTAPEQPGTYTLYELADEHKWEHRGFRFEKEEQ